MLKDALELLPESEEPGCSKATSSSFSDLYKYWNRTMSSTLEKRRQMFLEKQKETRKEAFDEKRDLAQLFADEPEPMEIQSRNIPKKGKKLPFDYKLMQSEWFLGVPEDFSAKWVFKMCPQGVRLLVVANKATTTCYYRNGKVHSKFKSELPGGDTECSHRLTVLDCVYNKDFNRLYVCDVLAWNSVSLTSAEAEMRFYFLKSKFQEEPNMRVIDDDKNFKFKLVESLPAEMHVLQSELMMRVFRGEQEVSYDGVLFYHKEGQYTFGRSPLVGWLKIFMLPEIFQIPVHEVYMRQAPHNYQGVIDYLTNKKKNKNRLMFNPAEVVMMG